MLNSAFERWNIFVPGCQPVRNLHSRSLEPSRVSPDDGRQAPTLVAADKALVARPDLVSDQEMKQRDEVDGYMERLRKERHLSGVALASSFVFRLVS